MTKEICEVAIQQANAPDLKGRLPLDLGLLPEAVRNQLGGMRELTGFSSNSGVVWCTMQVLGCHQGLDGISPLRRVIASC